MERQVVASPSLYKVQIPINALPADALVYNLMVDGTKQWNKSLIEDVFWKEEAILILHTLIS